MERSAAHSPIDVSRAAQRFRRLQHEQDLARADLYANAQIDLERALEVARAFPQVRRVRVWGSLLRPDRFTERSDIDICIEGISSPIVWSQLEQRLLSVVRLPLDLLRWEDLMQPHRDSIEARGKVIYESA